MKMLNFGHSGGDETCIPGDGTAIFLFWVVFLHHLGAPVLCRPFWWSETGCLTPFYGGNGCF